MKSTKQIDNSIKGDAKRLMIQLASEELSSLVRRLNTGIVPADYYTTFQFVDKLLNTCSEIK